MSSAKALKFARSALSRLTSGSGVSAEALVGGAKAMATKSILPGPTKRPPTRRDDITRGYSAGALWNFNGQIYVAINTAAGAASWSPIVTDNAPILDAVPGASAAYGTILLRAAYAGFCMNVVRASDGTNKDIGFVQQGSQKVLDTAALDAFLAGTTGTVATLYDQSGNGLDAVQTTAANRPVIGHKMIGGVRVLTFLGDTTTGAIHFLNLPAGLATARTATSQYAAITPLTTVLPQGYWETGSLAAGALLLYQDDAGVNDSRLRLQNGTARALSVARTSPSVMSIISGASTAVVTQDNSSTSVPTGGTLAMTGGMIGNTTRVSNYQGRFDLGALIFYPSAHSATQKQTVLARLFANFGITPQSDVVLHYDGDSITYGRTVVEGAERASQTPAFGETYPRYNWGIGGQTAATAALRYATRAGNSFDPTKRNILILFAGTNDLNGGATGTAAWASIVSEMQAARATGYKILVATMLPRGDFSPSAETERGVFNTLMRANWNTYADGLLDYAADPTMGAAGATSNTALYADLVHPTRYGDSLLAAIDAQGIEALAQDYRYS